MATKIELLSHEDKTLSPITKASNVLFENGKTAQDILNDKQDENFTPKITSSSSMFKVGQGDNADYSSNVANGAYESIVLKGKTTVNCIQEPSSQDVVLPYEFTDGQYVTINDTKESGALGVELKGQTLVNLVPKKIIDYTASSDWDGYHQLVQNSKQSFDEWRALQDLKPNTKYYISCYVETFEDVNNRYYCLNNPSVGTIFEDSMIVNGVGRYQWLSTTKSELTDETFIALRCQNSYTRGAIKIRDIMIIEYVEGMEEWDIPYFEGMASCKMPTLHTVGKNLFDTNNSTDGYGFSEGVILDKSDWFLSNYVRVEPNATYVMSCDGESGKRVQFYDRDKKLVTHNRFENNVILVPNNRNIVYMRTNAPLTLKSSLQIEKGGSKTTYENHKTSILSLPEEVVLRSLPNGVCDTFNTRTGVYTQRIGEITVDGSEGWVAHNNRGENGLALTFKISPSYFTNAKLSDNSVQICDKIGSKDSSPALRDYDCYAMPHRDGTGYITVVKTKLNTQDLDGFKKYLGGNPHTIQYELTTPIVTKINLPSTLKSWNTTTHIYSEIPENTLYPILSHSNPTYPVILKPSTKYSIVANSYSNDHTNSAINFNLGGATTSTTVGNRVTTVTTLSTLSNELLTMSGRGNKLNNVMVIEGDVAGDEPYFEGICDCKSPILTNLDANNEQLNTTTFDQKDDKTIVLRSLPSGVCDTLNVETGEYVQHIEEITFDGSSDEIWGLNTVWSSGDYCAFWEENTSNKLSTGYAICDKMPTKKDSELINNGVAISNGWRYMYQNMYIFIAKNKLSSADTNGLRQYLSQNPVTVQYELATPIVSTIDVQGFPHAYKDGHVQLSSGHSGQSLTPKVEYSLPTNRNGQIRSNQKMVEKHQKELDKLQAIVLANLVNSQYNQTLTTLNYELSRV